MIQEIDRQEFKDRVLGGEGLILVDFNASWCGPCQMLHPILERIAEDGYKLFSVDIDQQPVLAAEYGIMSVPTMLIFRDGKKLEQMVGLQPESRIRATLEELS